MNASIFGPAAPLFVGYAGNALTNNFPVSSTASCADTFALQDFSGGMEGVTLRTSAPALHSIFFADGPGARRRAKSGEVEEMTKTVLMTALQDASRANFHETQRLRQELMPKFDALMAKTPSLAEVTVNTLLENIGERAKPGEGVMVTLMLLNETVESATLYRFFNTLFKKAAIDRSRAASKLIVMTGAVVNPFYKRQYDFLIERVARRIVDDRSADPRLRRFAKRVLAGEVQPGFVEELKKMPWMEHYLKTH